MVTVLFTQKNSIYKQLNCDCWDITRNALNWPGGNPIIAHPPCRLWGNFNWAKGEPPERQLAIWALQQIRQYGGVLEHPRTSKLWKEQNLPTGTNQDQYGGWTLNIDQYWFGHRAKKNTLLYIVGTSPKNIPDLPIRITQNNTTKVEQMGKKEREQTPLQLAIWLIKLIEIIETNTFINEIKNKKEQ